jgi:AcrR family transcriptional regulator
MSNNDGRVDPRIRRTRKMMLDSLLSLIIEKGFDAVSVTDIAERAMINRTTFYNHYEDKGDLLERGMEEVLDSLRGAQGEPNPDPGAAVRDAPPPALVAVFRHFAENERFYRAMLGPNGVPSFAAKLRQSSEAIIRERLEFLAAQSDRKPSVPLELVIQYAVSSYTGIAVWWLEQHMPYSPEQLARYYIQLSAAGLYGSIGLPLPTG